MNYPVKNWEKWYDAQPYGTKTSYGYHDGCDINLLSGADSDFGQPLLAVADGTISSVHSHTTSPTFGNHIHLEFTINGKTYYAHYAHCRDVFVSVGQTVKQGDNIATIGKSGTQYAHCHFAIKNQPTGVDGIAKTLDDLKKWENPIKFIEANLGNVIISPPDKMDYKAIFDKTGDIKGLEDRSPKPDFYAPEDEFKKAYVDPTNGNSYVVVNLKALNDTLSYLRDQSKPIITTTPSNAPQTGDNFEAVTDAPVEVKPVLPTYPATEFEPFEWLWNKISQLWKR